jgi:hypothetical protein
LTAVIGGKVVGTRILEPASHLREGVKPGWRRSYARRLAVTDTAVIVSSVGIDQFARFGTDSSTLTITKQCRQSRYAKSPVRSMLRWLRAWNQQSLSRGYGWAKTALITGVTSPDGSYLAEFLLEKGYDVHGTKRRISLFNPERVDHIYQDPHTPDGHLTLHYGDLTAGSNLTRIISEVRDVSLLHSIGWSEASRLEGYLRRPSSRFPRMLKLRMNLLSA